MEVGWGVAMEDKWNCLMMVSTINSGMGLAPFEAAFDPVRSWGRTTPAAPPRSSNSSADFFESLSATLSKATSFQDRVNALVQELKLQDDRALTSGANVSNVADLEKAQAEPHRSDQPPVGEVSQIGPELLTLMALPTNRSLDELA